MTFFIKLNFQGSVPQPEERDQEEVWSGCLQRGGWRHLAPGWGSCFGILENGGSAFLFLECRGKDTIWSFLLLAKGKHLSTLLTCKCYQTISWRFFGKDLNWSPDKAPTKNLHVWRSIGWTSALFPGGFAPNVQDNNEVRIGLMTSRAVAVVVSTTPLVGNIGWLIDPLIKLIAWFMYPFSSCAFFLVETMCTGGKFVSKSRKLSNR